MADRALTPVDAGDLQWRWLEEFRTRFDLAIELIDPDLQFLLAPAQVGHAVRLRTIVGDWNDEAARASIAIALQTGTPQSFDAGELRVRIFPLRAAAPAIVHPVGALLLAGPARELPGRRDREEEALDARLDGAARWLVPAIEATVDAAGRVRERSRSGRRAAAVLSLMQAIVRSEDHREMFARAAEALATVYNVDVRVYHHDTAGAYVPGIDPPAATDAATTLRIPDAIAAGRNDVFRLDPDELAEIAIAALAADTLFAPIGDEDSPEWLLACSGGDAATDQMLGLVRRVINLRLADLNHEAEDRVRRRVATVLGFAAPPFPEVAQMALAAAAAEIGAPAAQLALYTERTGSPMLTIGHGPYSPQVPPPLEAGATIVRADVVVAAAAVGDAPVVVIEFRAPGSVLGTRAERLARVAAGELGIWMSGLFVTRTEARTAFAGDFVAEFARRVRTRVEEQPGRPIGGAVAVVVPDVSAERPATLDTAVEVLQREVRSSDATGVVGSEGAWVLLPSATQEATSAIAARLLRAAREHGLVAARVGVATFDPSADAPERLLEQALRNARGGSALA